MKKLNLGCGRDIKKGYINADFIKETGVDVVHDLNKTPYPFKSNEFDEIYASHVLEHLDGDWFSIISELYRILKPHGKIIVKVPHFTSAVAFIENHRRFFRYRSFEDFSMQKTLKGLDQIKFNKMKIISRRINFIRFPLVYNIPIEIFVNSSPSAAIFYENSFLRAIFPANELTFTLEK